jgi:hypothetical protein
MKTTNEMRFDNLFVEYKILRRMDAKTAQANFTEAFNILVEDCANRLYDGDINNTTMHKALWNNLVADKRTRYNNVEKYSNGYAPENPLKLELVELIATILPAEARKVAPKEANAETGKLSKSFWMYSVEEIEAVTDLGVLDSIYKNVASAKSSATTLAKAIELFELVDEDAAKAYFDTIRAAVNKRKAEVKQPVLSENLMEKLAKGSHTTLSKSEVEELLKALNK